MFERLALPGMTRAPRFELLVALGAAGRYELEPDQLQLGVEDDATTQAAKRILLSGDKMLLERRARDLAARATSRSPRSTAARAVGRPRDGVRAGRRAPRGDALRPRAAVTPCARSGPLLLLLACVLLATLAQMLPAGPTYDPWAWITWGREITEWDLDTRTGPSWKPLPVLFTTPFALAGDDAAPELWLIVAQAGGLLAFAFTYRLAARLAGWPAGVIAGGRPPARRRVHPQLRARQLGGAARRPVPVGDRAAPRRPPAPGVPAGRRRRAAAARSCGRSCSLYGLWLMWSRPPTRLLVVGCGVLTLLLWFVPEYLGSGDFMRAASRAREPNPDSAAFADIPFVETFGRSASVLMVPLLLGAAIALGRAWRDGTRCGSPSARWRRP